jgi:hypothetical protein
MVFRRAIRNLKPFAARGSELRFVGVFEPPSSPGIVVFLSNDRPISKDLDRAERLVIGDILPEIGRVRFLPVVSYFFANRPMLNDGRLGGTMPPCQVPLPIRDPA